MMDGRERSSLLRAVGTVVREYVASAAAEVSKRVERLEKWAAEMPVVRDGHDGKDADMDAIRAFVSSEVEAIVSAIPVPKDGKDAPPVDVATVIAEVVKQVPTPKNGKDGESIVGPQGPQGEKGESIKGDKGDQGESIVGPKGDPGESIKGEKGDKGDPGRDVDPKELAAVVREAVGLEIKALPIPKDGKNGKDAEIHPDTLSLMVVTEVQKAVSAIPPPKDGKTGDPGRDALQLEILPAIDIEKSYPRGTYAKYKSGVIHAVRNTAPITKDLDTAGWDVLLDGEDSVTFPDSDDTQVYTEIRHFTSGKTVTHTRRMPWMDYRFIYRAGEEYFKGQAVTWNGSVWICVAESTKSSPAGNSHDWKLIVKAGNPGKDAPPTPAIAPDMDAIVTEVVKRLRGTKS